MGRKSRAKRAEREEKKDEREAAQAAFARRQSQRRIVLLAIPIVVAAVAAGFWFGLEDRKLAAASLLVGALVWLMAGLGFVGSSIAPRDRIKANSIDFGKRGRR